MKKPKSPINAQILIDEKGMMKTFPATARVSRAIHYIKQKPQHVKAGSTWLQNCQ